MFLINSRYSQLSATQKRFRSKSLHILRHTFSRSYGVKLPSSLTKIHLIALDYSSHSPESVYGTSSVRKHVETFLGGMAQLDFEAQGLSPMFQNCAADLPTTLPTHLDLNQLEAQAYLPRPSYATLTLVTEY